MEWAKVGVPWWEVGKCQNSRKLEDLKGLLSMSFFFEFGLIFEFVGIFLVFVLCSKLVVEGGTKVTVISFRTVSSISVDR